ncbi:MAG: alpha/beta hydrolase [Pigmentiphaga sp.]
MTIIYRSFDQASLDTAYNNQAAVEGFASLVADWRHRSALIARNSDAQLDLAYGSKPRQLVDYYPQPAGAPLLVFIHGGYWQGGEKRSVGFLAEGPLSRGFAVVMVEYTVAPDGRLSEMVSEIRSSLAWLRHQAAELGFDATRIFLAGHSAGAQLLCNVLDEKGVIAGVAISGLYDLEPIRLSYLNKKLALVPDDVEQYSPIHNLPLADVPLVVSVGANELPELVRQSHDFADLSKAIYLPLSGHNHFTILDELAKPDGSLCRLLDELCNKAKARV